MGSRAKESRGETRANMQQLRLASIAFITVLWSLRGIFEGSAEPSSGVFEWIEVVSCGELWKAQEGRQKGEVFSRCHGRCSLYCLEAFV